MNNTINRQNINDLSPSTGPARQALIANIGANNRAIAANLSIALARRRKHVCLIAADSPSSNSSLLPEQSRRSPLEELLAGRKVLTEVLRDGPAGIRILSAGLTFTNFFHMAGTEQVMLVELLAHLETAFDYIIVETGPEADNGLLQLYQSIPLILLTITPEADSLTSAFSLLRALRSQTKNQPIHIIVDMAENLPNAHETFKKIKLAASKYLQIEPHYLGYFPSPQPLQGSVKRTLTPTDFYPDSQTESHMDAIADRFFAIAERTIPLTGLSHHFSELCSKRKLTAESVKFASEQESKAAESAQKLPLCTPHNPGGWHERLNDRIALYDAVHYASMLAKREAKQGRDN